MDAHAHSEFYLK